MKGSLGPRPWKGIDFFCRAAELGGGFAHAQSGINVISCLTRSLRNNRNTAIHLPRLITTLHWLVGAYILQ